MKKIAVFLLAALVLASCGKADGQTASQTIAYIVFGLKDGGGFPTVSGSNAVLHTTSVEPLIYELVNSDPSKAVDKLKFSVNRLDDCNYAFTVENHQKAASEIMFAFRLDLTDLKSASLVKSDMGMGSAPYGTRLEGAKMTCEGTGRSGDMCNMFAHNNQMIPLTAAEPESLAKTLTYFRSNFCKGQS